MKLTNVPFYPANHTNFTKGRTRPIKYITIHHSAGLEQTLRYLWADPNRNGSSHFWVGNKHMEQYVDTSDTAWTNGNWRSNSESITIEVRGDWRGYYNQATLNNLETLLKKLRKIYPKTDITYHKDVSDRMTLCPADLKDKGYARKVWNKVTNWLSAPAPSAKITYKPISPKRVKLVEAASLWDFDFADWSQARPVEDYRKGHIVDVVAVATNQLGGKYYMTAYSYDGGKIRNTHGFNIRDTVNYVPDKTKSPTIAPKWEAMLTPRKLRTAEDIRIVDLDTNEEFGDVVKAGTDIELVEKKTLKNNRMYLRSKWAKKNDKNWGVPMDSLEEIKKEVPREPVPEPPIDVDPDEPNDSDVIEKASGIVEAIKALLDKLLNIIKGDNK